MLTVGEIDSVYLWIIWCRLYARRKNFCDPMCEWMMIFAKVYVDDSECGKRLFCSDEDRTGMAPIGQSWSQGSTIDQTKRC
ncbi:hypothetical protein V1477_011794 [Vespula maculifrons]|uniref:Uncharacterized protein n=1 Tax=Vespula maculifrons TaxID=7453 RepID=A0ABD2C0A4_VESMC